MPGIILSKFLVWKLQRLVLGNLLFCALFTMQDIIYLTIHVKFSSVNRECGCICGIVLLGLGLSLSY